MTLKSIELCYTKQGKTKAVITGTSVCVDLNKCTVISLHIFLAFL